MCSNFPAVWVFIDTLQDDEYVVYSTDQQMLSYLVEFTVGAELPDEISLDTMLMEAEETLAETNIGEWLNPKKKWLIIGWCFTQYISSISAILQWALK